MVFFDNRELGWKPYMESWVNKKTEDEDFKDFILELVDSLIEPVLKEKRERCKDLVPCMETQLVISFCKLLDSLSLEKQNGISFDEPKKNDLFLQRFEIWFTFAMIWSIGATVNEEGRKILDYFIRDIKPIFSPEATVYDYYISLERGELVNYAGMLQTSWKPI